MQRGQCQSDVEAQIFIDGVRGLLLAGGGFALVGLIGLIDCVTGPDFSFGIFYLVPIALGAWKGGFGQGILLALASAVSWQSVEILKGSTALPIIQLWNGTSRFGIFVITASLLSRLRVSLFLEKKLARADSLTGAANGRTFYETVNLATAWSMQTSCPLTLVYLDLDNFKWLNDAHGHAKGDEALCDLVQMIREQIRPTDLLARLGGDEFALLLSDCGGEQAMTILQRLQERLGEEMAKKKWPLTLSVGAMTFLRPLRDIDAMVQCADRLMYEAKHAGKNRIVHRVIEGGDGAAEAGAKLERRTTAREICNRLARVRPEGNDETGDDYARVRDISATGLCLRLERQLPEQALLAIEPLHECGAKTLLVRVLWSVEEDGGWCHECVLPNRLSPEELRLWILEQSAESHFEILT
jgi:diguanylate cyclase (GGDEF)-like protein